MMHTTQEDTTMSIDYTRKERDAINLAWACLIDFAESSRMGDAAQLKDALRREKRNVSSPAVARALLLSTLVEVRDTDHRTGITKTTLWTYRSPHRDMIAFAWHWHWADALSTSDTYQLVCTAVRHHETAFRRDMDALTADPNS